MGMLGCNRVELNKKWVTADIGVDKAREAQTSGKQYILHDGKGGGKGRGVDTHIVAFSRPRLEGSGHTILNMGSHSTTDPKNDAAPNARLDVYSIAKTRTWARRKRTRATRSEEGGEVVCSAPRRIDLASAFLTAATTKQPKA